VLGPGYRARLLAPASVTVGGVGYSLKWSDEFKASALDTTHRNNAATWCCGQGTNLAKSAYRTDGGLDLKDGNHTRGSLQRGLTLVPLAHGLVCSLWERQL
jgi:hypothetical protein